MIPTPPQLKPPLRTRAEGKHCGAEVRCHGGPGSRCACGEEVMTEALDEATEESA